MPLNKVSLSATATNYRAVKEGRFFTTILKRRFVFVRMKQQDAPALNEQLALF
ncbi:MULTISPECIES: hypothetical protein [Vibrio harveyi group]|nr:MULTISPECIES: hypothetical protein [Vibrio harveyi group]EHR5319976.1 hypothetical protein [Vibrio parahaemolyticus]EJB8688795.1 hypothetical protein [Vibrio parahaemolyticus]MBE3791294.1 hypothetical protein [Vibrio parahaemolyticus]MBE3866078.1 hypothetical protein [Vibrio parahaemolyticus]MBE3899206.1 hypothetical protein [Vibrio parahaemolyticus]